MISTQLNVETDGNVVYSCFPNYKLQFTLLLTLFIPNTLKLCASCFVVTEPSCCFSIIRFVARATDIPISDLA